ncbi:MAG: FecCD family ABC transporter permease [Anaerovoracaceae bacterium]|jgi:iron complex transport system permease protein
MKENHSYTIVRKKVWPAFSIAVAMLLFFFFLSLNLGRVSVNFSDMILILMQKMGYVETFSEANILEKQLVFFNVRFPRSLLAMSVGMALAVAGSVMQTLYRNPLASPDVLGVTQAANFGVGIAIFFFSWGTIGIQITSFLFGVGALLFTFAMVSRIPGKSVTALVLIGVIVSALFQAGLTLLLYMSDPYSEMLRINYWLMGAFNTANWQKVSIVLPTVLVGSIFLYVFSWRLNVLAQSDEEAMSLGINLKLWRFVYIIFVAMIVAISTAAVGNIAWVGLIIPHIARYFVGTDQRKVVPFSGLLGALMLLIIDTIIRNLPTGEIPISVITSFIAAPFLAIMVMKRRGTW